MSSFAETGPREPVTEGIRVDKVQPRARLAKKIRAIIVVIVAIILQIFYNYIIAKLDSIVNDMEDASITLMDLLVRHKK